MPQVSAGVFSQRYWPGIGSGPLDDCWVLADFQALYGCDPRFTLPTIAAYRKAANIAQWKPVYPDTSASEGGALEHSEKALKALWPKGGALLQLYRGTWDGFLAAMKAGHGASVNVLSGALPASMQFGFLLNHRVYIYWSAGLASLRIMNPLARPHSRPVSITQAALRTAMAAYPSAEPACALIFPTTTQLAAA